MFFTFWNVVDQYCDIVRLKHECVLSPSFNFELLGWALLFLNLRLSLTLYIISQSDDAQKGQIGCATIPLLFISQSPVNYGSLYIFLPSLSWNRYRLSLYLPLARSLSVYWQEAEWNMPYQEPIRILRSKDALVPSSGVPSFKLDKSFSTL